MGFLKSWFCAQKVRAKGVLETADGGGGFFRRALLGGRLDFVSPRFPPVFVLRATFLPARTSLEAMSKPGPGAFGWLVPIPFYFLELGDGSGSKPLVFMLLTAVFTHVDLPA